MELSDAILFNVVSEFCVNRAFESAKRGLANAD